MIIAYLLTFILVTTFFIFSPKTQSTVAEQINIANIELPRGEEVERRCHSEDVAEKKKCQITVFSINVVFL